MGFGMDVATNAASGIIGQGMNLLFGGIQDKRQLKQQGKLQDLQIKGQKDLTDYTNEAQRKMQMQMWNDTGLPEQVKKAKEAGMSIAALYGGSGTGGATTGGGGGGGSVAGAQAGDPNAGVGMGLQMASQLALQKAQKENIEADTANKKAGIDLTAEDIQKRKMDTLTQGEEWTKKQAESQEANRGLEDRLKKLHAEATGAEIENEAKKVGIKVDKERINQMIAQVAQGWENLDQGQQRLKIEKFRQEIDANYPGVWNVAGKYVNDFVDGLNRLIGQKDYKKHEIK